MEPSPSEFKSDMHRLEDKIEKVMRMQHVILHTTLASQSSTLAQTAMDFLRETSQSSQSEAMNAVSRCDNKRVGAVMTTLVQKMKQLIAISQTKSTFDEQQPSGTTRRKRGRVSPKRSRRDVEADAEISGQPLLETSLQNVTRTTNKVDEVLIQQPFLPELSADCVQYGHTNHGVVFRHVATLLSCLGYTVFVCDTAGVRFVRTVPEVSIDVFFSSAALQPYHNRYAFGVRVDSNMLHKACASLKRKNSCTFRVNEALSTLTFTITGATSAINEHISLSPEYEQPRVDQCSTDQTYQMRTTIEELHRVCRKLITEQMFDVVIRGGDGWMTIGITEDPSTVCRIGGPSDSPCQYEHFFEAATFLHIAKICNINRGNVPITMRPGPNFTFITKAASIGLVTISIASRAQTILNMQTAEAIKRSEML